MCGRRYPPPIPRKPGRSDSPVREATRDERERMMTEIIIIPRPPSLPHPHPSNRSQTPPPFYPFPFTAIAQQTNNGFDFFPTVKCSSTFPLFFKRAKLIFHFTFIFLLIGLSALFLFLSNKRFQRKQRNLPPPPQIPPPSPLPRQSLLLLPHDDADASLRILSLSFLFFSSFAVYLLCPIHPPPPPTPIPSAHWMDRRHCQINYLPFSLFLFPPSPSSSRGHFPFFLLLHSTGFCTVLFIFPSNF